MFRADRMRLRHGVFAALVGALAVIARAVAQPLLGDTLPFLAAVPAMILASVLWGAVPGLIAAALCAFGAWLPSIPPTIAAAKQAQAYALFMASSLVTCGLCHLLRGSRWRETPGWLATERESPLGLWLKTMLLGAIFLPASAFVAASWWSLDKAASEASLSHALELAHAHARKTFAVARAIAERADVAAVGLDESTRRREPGVHTRLADMTAGIDAIVNANVWDASGAILARSDAYPVDPAYSIADRGYFKQLQAAHLPVAISEVMTGRQSGKRVLNVSIPRHSDDGRFGGIVSVTLTPAFFNDYYKSLAHEEPTLATFALVRSDGAILARWPEDAGSSYLVDGGVLRESFTAGSRAGHLVIATDAGRGTQMVRYERVEDLPVYVVAGISRPAMLRSWGRFVGVLAAILLPVTAGLVYVTWVAMKKTRAEVAVSSELQDQIRARAAAERRMLESQRLETLAFVTSSVAHDFNNMLAVITSSLHVHKIQWPEAADDKALGAISRSVQAGVRLTRQLLSFSKKQALRPEIVVFQDWLPAADALMRSTLGSACSWISRVDADTRPVKVDPGELELALVNVVLNAKLAMPSGGQLSVHISNDEHAPADSPRVIVCVIDTGEGIAPAVLGKVFDPFFTTRERGVGSGLGLTQVQAFCVQSGGWVTVVSTPGKGTTLCMHLPACPEEVLPDRDPATTPIGRLEAHLLLVEDNEEVGRMTEQLLLSCGMTVSRVTSADAALAWLGAAGPRPEIVLSDVAMPGSMSGIGLANEIARLYPGLPVLLHTGYAEQIEQARLQGLRVLQKPVPPQVMLQELSALLLAARGADT
jgi:two-component system NtrC family sensor kinase